MTIADVYDAITSPRIYRPTVISPDKAPGYMMEDPGTSFDPTPMKVFADMLGVYPVGTLLKLDTNEMGLSLRHTKNKARPEVQLIKPEFGKGFSRGSVVDLNERDQKTGRYKRNIVKTINPAKLGIQPAAHIF